MRSWPRPKHIAFHSPRSRRNTRPKRVRVAVLSLILLGLLKISAASAHMREAGDLIINHPWAEPARAGEATRLRLQVLNETRNDYHILSVTSPIAAGTRIFVSVAPNDYRQVHTLSVLPEETLRLNTSHILIELIGLKRDLKKGDRFKATLHFVNGAQLAIDVLVGDNGPGHDKCSSSRC